MVKRGRAGRTRSRQAPITCEQVTALLLDYLAGELDPETTSAFEGHLQGCTDCAAFLNTYRKTIHAVHSLRYEEIPPQVEDRVRRFLQKRFKGVPRSR